MKDSLKMLTLFYSTEIRGCWEVGKAEKERYARGQNQTTALELNGGIR